VSLRFSPTGVPEFVIVVVFVLFGELVVEYDALFRISVRSSSLTRTTKT
jgi:hypothetical protein